MNDYAKKIFVNFDKTRGGEANKFKFILSGNPVRSEITKLKNSAREPDGKLYILIIGGSLGAKSINEMLGKYIKKNRLDSSVFVRHQVGLGKGFNSQVADSVIYQQLEFIDDIAKEYKWADIIVCRSGASTISELRYVKKPVILIPYPQATDNHQFYNALLLKDEVDFPILVNSVEELGNDNFKILNSFFTKFSNFKVDESLSDLENVEEIIWKEIKSDL